MKRERGGNISTLTQSPLTPSIDNFLHSKITNHQANIITNSLTRLKTLDPQFGEMVKGVENKWVGEIEAVLMELITEVRRRITYPSTTMGELLRAIDLLDNRLNSNGIP